MALGQAEWIVIGFPGSKIHGDILFARTLGPCALPAATDGQGL